MNLCVPFEAASKVKAGKANFTVVGGEQIEVMSVSVDPDIISFTQISEKPSRLSSLSAFSPGKKFFSQNVSSHV